MMGANERTPFFGGHSRPKRALSDCVDSWKYRASMAAAVNGRHDPIRMDRKTPLTQQVVGSRNGMDIA
jgi:hypothetical protein